MTTDSGSGTGTGKLGTVDWASVEPEFIANIVSIASLAVKYGCTEGAIRKHFKKLDIKRNPKQKIKDKAAELVRKEEVRSANAKSKGTEKQQVDAAAQNQADLILLHRKDIKLKRDLVEKLYGELLVMTDRGGEIVDILDHLKKDKDNDWMERLLDKVAALPARIKGVSNLQKAFESLIKLERQAFGITGDEDPDDKVPTSGSWQFVAVAVKRGD